MTLLHFRRGPRPWGPAFVLSLAFGLAGCGGSAARLDDAAAEARPTPVRLAVAGSVAELQPVALAGLVARRTEADLSFKIGGVLAAVLVRPGDAVTAGQVLARLEPDEIEAEVARASSALAKAERDQARAEELVRDRVATLEQAQDARTAVEVAAAALRIAEFNRRFAEIRAPAAGRVLRRQAEPGELVAPGRAILAFAADGDGWIVRTGVPAADALTLQPGQPAVAVLPGGHRVEAVVAQVAEAADPRTRTIEAELALAGVPPGVRSGLVVRVELPRPRVDPPWVTVPAAALVVGDGDSARVFRLEPDGRTVRSVSVRVAEIAGAEARLRTGSLAVGERVVSVGAELLRDGAPVAPETAPASPTTR